MQIGQCCFLRDFLLYRLTRYIPWCWWRRKTWLAAPVAIRAQNSALCQSGLALDTEKRDTKIEDSPGYKIRCEARP